MKFIPLILLLLITCHAPCIFSQTSTVWIGDGTITPGADGGTAAPGFGVIAVEVSYSPISGWIYFAHFGAFLLSQPFPRIRYATSVSGTVATYITNAAAGATSSTVNVVNTAARLTSILGIIIHHSSTANIALYATCRDSYEILKSDLTTNFVTRFIGTGVAANVFNAQSSIDSPTLGGVYKNYFYVPANTDLVRIPMIGTPILLKVGSSGLINTRVFIVFRGLGYFCADNSHAVQRIHLATGIKIVWKGSVATASVVAPLFSSPRGLAIDCGRKILYVGHQSISQVALSDPAETVTRSTTATYNDIEGMVFASPLNLVFATSFAAN
eukprot:PhF_6_TR24466/c0_g1_i1/m.33826